MKDKFVKYLPHVLPSIFSMATLQPQMGVSGSDALANLSDVMNEIKPDQGGAQKTSVVTDETEEKDTAIQMLSVFIDELGEAFFDYAPHTSKILLSLTNYTASDNIRTTAVTSIPGLVKCVKSKTQ